jgi:hypothetical protein
MTMNERLRRSRATYPAEWAESDQRLGRIRSDELYREQLRGLDAQWDTLTAISSTILKGKTNGKNCFRA